MDDLHAAIAKYLRAHRQSAPAVREGEEAILALWRKRAGVPHCRYCGKPIAAGDDIWDVEQLRAARACGDHYAPF